MATCPNCHQKISPGTILRSPFPVWITCPECGAKLVGNRLVKLQGVLVIPLTALIVWLALAFGAIVAHPLLALLILVALFIAGMTYVTLRWGSYRTRSLGEQQAGNERTPGQ